jgi:phosphoribosylamine--glycine ligase
VKVLVVGSGAREHALVRALSLDPAVDAVTAAPGNPGIAAVADLVPIAAGDVDALAAWASGNGIGLVVVGPEAPLAAGLADRLEALGIPVFGPTRAAAELEWSKVFAKQFMLDHGVPTAKYAAFDELQPALAYAAAATYPQVVKADGLAAGKGVAVCASLIEAEAAIRAALQHGAFGTAGARVVIEDFLPGEELSVIALTDGERIAVLPPARDHKRLLDGDRGPNTGGMGAIAPVPSAAGEPLARVLEEILRPTIAGLAAMGRPYRGAIYAGVMLTADGPKTLEFNCRFGDPETQAILPLLGGDLAALLLACATGRLDPADLDVRPGAAVSLVLAADGYPERPRSGDAISGIAEAEAAGALVFHPGTALNPAGGLESAGGRVLSVVGTGDSVAAAADVAYAAAGKISFAGMHLRGDIGRSPAADQGA